jgi:UPF0755 protein
VIRALLVLAAGAMVVGGVLLAVSLRPVGGDRVALVSVPSGSSLSGVARDLEERGLVRSGRAMSVLGRLQGAGHRLKAGRYRVDARQSAAAILDDLVTGRIAPIRITFPEGIWLPEVARLLADSLQVSAEAVMAAATDSALLVDLGLSASSAEGYLFPSTYDFEGSEPARELVARMVGESTLRWTPERARAAQALGMSRHEIMTMASIVEAETGRADERRKVSAVYHRRLRKGWLLQADPTVVYALGVRGRAPSLADLKIGNPYNTYAFKRLPPGPIGNPGEASIDAALDPDWTCSALFFIARADGSHDFSDTFGEHLRKKGARDR